MKNSIKFVLTAVCLCSASLALAAWQEKADVFSAQAQKEMLSAQKAQALSVYTLQTTWQRCEQYVSRPRGNGKRVRVSKPWTCEDVTTSCGAVVSEAKAYAAASCVYAPTSERQTLTLKKSILTSADGSRIVLKNFLGKVKDLVAFALN